jgi:hypothetical protein
MVDIQTVSIAIASAGILVAAIYYVLQIRHQARMRQTDLVMRLYSTYGSMEFQEARERIMSREFKDLDDYIKEYGSKEISVVGLFFEGIGVLLKRKNVDISMIDDLLGVATKSTWEKMKILTEEYRKRYNQPKIFEWFEYLYNEIQKREQQLAKVK